MGSTDGAVIGISDGAKVLRDRILLGTVVGANDGAVVGNTVGSSVGS